MAKRISVVISQGQSANPDKRGLEESLVGALLMERGVEVTVIPHLYDLAPGNTGMLCLEGIAGDMIVLSWLYPRAAHWTLDRNGIKGHFGRTLLESEAADEDEESEQEEAEAEAEDDKPRVGGRDLPNRTIYHLHLSAQTQAEPFLAEIRRIVTEANVETVGLMDWINGSPKPESLARFLDPAAHNGHGDATNGDGSSTSGGPLNIVAPPGEPTRVDETPARRWYPVIDYSRCTNCMECIDFCLFGVYGVDGVETILVEQPDNCRKGCPACSRVCPENAIIFPQHKSPAIAGSPDENAGGLKIDLSQLFGAPNAIEVAAQERDTELVAVGRDAVGLSVGIPKRQAGKDHGPKDELDSLMDQLDNLDL
jgi:NAD-dependent dihydropyrimidine dehydrogenase PreA subunit